MKKLLKGLLVSMVVACLGTTAVLADGSITVTGTPSQEVTVNGQKVEGAKVAFSDEMTDVPEETKALVEELNKGQDLATVLADAKFETEVDLAGYAMLTKMQDLTAVDKDGNPLKNVTVSWEVPNLTSNAGSVLVLHFSTDRQVWEVITPDKVDGTTVTATFADLSPVTVIYKTTTTGTGDDTTTGGSTNVPTGDNSAVGFYVALAAAAVCVGGFVVYRTKREF